MYYIAPHLMSGHDAIRKVTKAEAHSKVVSRCRPVCYANDMATNRTHVIDRQFTAMHSLVICDFFFQSIEQRITRIKNESIV